MFDSLMILMKEFFENFNFEKNHQTMKNACKITQHSELNVGDTCAEINGCSGI